MKQLLLILVLLTTLMGTGQDLEVFDYSYAQEGTYNQTTKVMTASKWIKTRTFVFLNYENKNDMKIVKSDGNIEMFYNIKFEDKITTSNGEIQTPFTALYRGDEAIGFFFETGGLAIIWKGKIIAWSNNPH